MNTIYNYFFKSTDINDEIKDFKQLLDKTDFKHLSQDKFMDHLPNETTLIDAKRLSKKENKPILMDFWTKSAQIGVHDNNEKRLIENELFYTSRIENIYHSTSRTEYLVVSKHSIFIVDANIRSRKVSYYDEDSTITIQE